MFGSLLSAQQNIRQIDMDMNKLLLLSNVKVYPCLNVTTSHIKDNVWNMAALKKLMKAFLLFSFYSLQFNKFTLHESIHPSMKCQMV